MIIAEAIGWPAAFIVASLFISIAWVLVAAMQPPKR